MEIALEPSALTPVLVSAINLIRDKALSNLRSRNVGVVTGNLERSFITRAGLSSKVASAWTKVGNKFSANHAHLIEFGHRIIGHKPNLKDTGKAVKGKPFFRDAVDSTRATVRKRVDEGILRLLWNSEK